VEGEHGERLREAIELEARAHRALLDGDPETARTAFVEAAARYRASWEVAPPGGYGRLIGMLKAAVIARDAQTAARHAREALPQDADSPPAHYARAIAALVEGDDDAALAGAAGMRAGSPAFGRAAAGIEALARGDAEAYAGALAAIVADFESRGEHLTGVPIADTALMLERLAEPRGLARRPASPLLPAA